MTVDVNLGYRVTTALQEVVSKPEAHYLFLRFVHIIVCLMFAIRVCRVMTLFLLFLGGKCTIKVCLKMCYNSSERIYLIFFLYTPKLNLLRIQAE